MPAAVITVGPADEESGEEDQRDDEHDTGDDAYPRSDLTDSSGLLIWSLVTRRWLDSPRRLGRGGGPGCWLGCICHVLDGPRAELNGQCVRSPSRCESPVKVSLLAEPRGLSVKWDQRPWKSVGLKRRLEHGVGQDDDGGA